MQESYPDPWVTAHPFQRTWVSFAWEGNDAERTYNDVFLLKWNDSTKTVEQESLSGLPTTIAFTAASTLGSKVYLAGGTETNDLGLGYEQFLDAGSGKGRGGLARTAWLARTDAEV